MAKRLEATAMLNARNEPEVIFAENGANSWLIAQCTDLALQATTIIEEADGITISVEESNDVPEELTAQMNTAFVNLARIEVIRDSLGLMLRSCTRAEDISPHERKALLDEIANAASDIRTPSKATSSWKETVLSWLFFWKKEKKGTAMTIAEHQRAQGKKPEKPKPQGTTTDIASEKLRQFFNRK